MPGMYTWGEVARIGWHAVSGARQVVKNGHEDADGGHGKRSDRITDRAEERRERNARAAFRKLDMAEDALADAEADYRAARGPEKAAARRARNDAKARVRRADAAARRYR